MKQRCCGWRTPTRAPLTGIPAIQPYREKGTGAKRSPRHAPGRTTRPHHNRGNQRAGGMFMADETKITPETVKQRAALAGIRLDEDRLEDIATTMEAALAPLRNLDLRAIRLVEPAVTFDAAWPESPVLARKGMSHDASH